MSFLQIEIAYLGTKIAKYLPTGTEDQTIIPKGRLTIKSKDIWKLVQNNQVGLWHAEELTRILMSLLSLCLAVLKEAGPLVLAVGHNLIARRPLTLRPPLFHGNYSKTLEPSQTVATTNRYGLALPTVLPVYPQEAPRTATKTRWELVVEAPMIGKRAFEGPF